MKIDDEHAKTILTTRIAANNLSALADTMQDDKLQIISDSNNYDNCIYWLRECVKWLTNEVERVHKLGGSV